MRKFRSWLINKFLPAWAKESAVAEIRRLEAENDRLEGDIERMNAYIDGLERGIRAQRRIIINTGAEK